MNNNPIIEVKNLVKSYSNEALNALNGVSFSIRKGEILSLMGPSGSGKSTLLNLLSTIDLPTAGDILIEGKKSTAYKPYDRFRAEYIGFVFQFHHLLSHLTLLENIELPMYSIESSKAERRKRAEFLLDKVGLADKKSSFPNRISGGERQLTAIARALANNPKLIIADEPTGSVDTGTGAMIIDYLIHHCTTNNLTMIIATHNNDIANKTHRIIHLENGLING
jgi:putative ABC transport system ATP-binding protein